MYMYIYLRSVPAQGFHYMLLLKNVSTIEHVEKRDPTKKDQVNPFDLGREKNWNQVLNILVPKVAGYLST